MKSKIDRIQAPTSHWPTPTETLRDQALWWNQFSGELDFV